MSRYVTPRRTQLHRRPDPRPFVPMRPGRISLIDLVIMVGLVVLAKWVGTHMHNLSAMLAVLAAAGVGLGLFSGFLSVWRHTRRSRPMISPSDETFR